MQSVKVDKKWLQAVVAKNRDGHRAEFERAFTGYRIECLRVLEENLAAFKAGRSRLVWSEVPPVDHTKDYDRVIAMLDASVDANIELTAEEFAQYAQDDWQWRQQWVMSNSKYLADK